MIFAFSKTKNIFNFDLSYKYFGCIDILNDVT